MKNDSDNFKVIFGHVELEQVRFTHGEDLGIDFHNSIDAWTKMEVIFRQQIKYLKDSKTLKRTYSKQHKHKADLNSLFYAFRDQFDS